MESIVFLVPMHIEFGSFIDPANNSRSFRKADGRLYNSLPTDLPLGPLSMSSFIKKHIDINVRIIDLNVEINILSSFPYDGFYEFCLDFLSKLDIHPNYVCVSSLFSPSFFNFLDCAKAVKRLYPDALVLGGGNIPTNSYSYIYNELGNNSFDALCYGEGELPLLGLLQAENKALYLSQSNSWITRGKLSTTSRAFSPEHNFINNLDDIPFFEYSLCNMDKKGLNPVTSGYATIGSSAGFHIMTSRGCPYKCTFCASHKVHGRKMRYYSINRVREDLTRLCNDYSATTIIFQDDHLMADKERVYAILKIVSELNLEAVFQNGLTLYALDRPMLEAFHAAGVRHLVLPVESGSEKVLKEQMRKPLKLSISERVANDCRELGIYTNTNILIGMPGETKADIEAARKNLRRINTNWFNIVCASPLIGSEMHEIATSKGYIKGDTLGADYRKAVIDTDDFTADYIQEMQYIMNLELNFVHNNDIRLGRYDLALTGMTNVIRIRPDHSLAHLFAAQCYNRLGNKEMCQYHRDKHLEFSECKTWGKYIKYFDLTDVDSIISGDSMSE